MLKLIYFREMVLTMHSAAVDSVLFGLDKAADAWCINSMEDSGRISIPLQPPDYTEHFPVGLAISLNSTQTVPISEYTTWRVFLIALSI